MIDIKKIINNKEEVLTNLNRRNKNYADELNSLIDNYNTYLKLLQLEEEAQAKINKLSKQIGELKRNGEDASHIFQEIEQYKKQIVNSDSKEYKIKYEALLNGIPNLLAQDVPNGKDEDDNQEVKVWGELPNFTFTPKDHYAVESASLNFHFDKAAKISKSRFVLTTSTLARLERSIMNYMLNTHTSRGYTEVAIPFIVGKETLQNAGQLPKFEDDLFKLQNNTKSEKDPETMRDFYLIPTAEVVLANFHQGEILQEENLTASYTAFSQCFRKEAGSAGRDTSGIIRMHQFGKVELFKYTTPENSFKELDLMVEDAEKILQDFELPYRVVKLCSGDIGFTSTTTYDLEVWMPGQNKYRECSSCSNVGDFQARRGKIRYKDRTGKKKLVHMINGSGMATGRILAAIIENYQNEDGTITIPKVLKPYME
ncbi:MAG: serine--tRNA ligase [Mycoplasmatales bacterium]